MPDLRKKKPLPLVSDLVSEALVQAWAVSWGYPPLGLGKLSELVVVHLVTSIGLKISHLKND